MVLSLCYLAFGDPARQCCTPEDFKVASVGLTNLVVPREIVTFLRLLAGTNAGADQRVFRDVELRPMPT